MIKKIIIEGDQRLNEAAKGATKFEPKTQNIVFDVIEALESLVGNKKDSWVAYSTAKGGQKVVLLSPITVQNWISNKKIMSADEKKTGIATPHKTFNHQSGLELDTWDKPLQMITFTDGKDAGDAICGLFGGPNKVQTIFVAVYDKTKALGAGRGKQYKAKDLWLDDKSGCELNPDAVSTTIQNLMTGFYHYDGL